MPGLPVVWQQAAENVLVEDTVDNGRCFPLYCLIYARFLAYWHT
ncbi:MAG: hypothetical protein WBP47_01080 [Candidatus Promineifilaceae bacterium]